MCVYVSVYVCMCVCVYVYVCMCFCVYVKEEKSFNLGAQMGGEREFPQKS